MTKVTRMELLRRLLDEPSSCKSIGEQLKTFDWDYDGTPLSVDEEVVRRALVGYLAGRVHHDDLSLWANMIESREDLDFTERASQVVVALANSEIMEAISPENVTRWLASLAEL